MKNQKGQEKSKSLQPGNKEQALKPGKQNGQGQFASGNERTDSDHPHEQKTPVAKP